MAAPSHEAASKVQRCIASAVATPKAGREA